LRHEPCGIDLIKGRSEAERKGIADAVYEAMRSIGVPADDRFQIIAEHDPSNFMFPRAYLGIEHTSDLVIVQITFNEGRTTAQKKMLYKAIDSSRSITGRINSRVVPCWFSITLKKMAIVPVSRFAKAYCPPQPA
jgi:hypothetical protein